MNTSRLMAQSSLFQGLTPSELETVARNLRPRHFGAREVICREGEPGNSLFVIQDGLALVMVSRPDSGDTEAVARLRRGDVVGEMSLITGEPRSATVLAAMPTAVLELGQDDFAAILAQYPAILLNLNRILSRRLARTNVRQVHSRRGEAVALIVDRRGASLVPDIVAATASAAPRSVVALDARSNPPNEPRRGELHSSVAPRFIAEVTSGLQLTQSSLESALALLDDLLAEHGTVLIVADVDQQDVSLTLDHVDRAVALLSDPSSCPDPTNEPSAISSRLTAHGSRLPRQAPLEVVLLADGREPDMPRSLRPPVPVIRVCRRDPNGRPASPSDIAWLGRHLSRTKLGLALGAGGAKGYAHVGALYLLEQAGYTVDYVAGSSIGALVGSWLAMGMSAAEVEATMRDAFTPDAVAAMFKLSMAGTSTGLDIMTDMCRRTTQDRSFADLALPLVVMSVDLNTRQPAPLREGPLWQALLAATALAGMFPPYQQGDRRLVDGLALVPVPTGSVLEAGADIAVSVNIISRETLPAWPGETPPEPAPAKAGSRMLDTLLEVMDLAQLDSSIRHAALADVVITPRFGPASWRDFHLADLFLTAGREAAEEQLASLRSLARPQSPHSSQSKGEVHGKAVHV